MPLPPEHPLATPVAQPAVLLSTQQSVCTMCKPETMAYCFRPPALLPMLICSLSICCFKHHLTPKYLTSVSKRQLGICRKSFTAALPA